MHPQLFVVLLTSLVAPTYAQSLLAVLQENGFTNYAELLKGSQILTSGPGLVVYAPTNAALEMNGNITLTRRNDDSQDNDETMGLFYCSSGTAPRFSKPRNGTKSMFHRNVPEASGFAYETLLNDPAWVNLGPGHNQSLVEKNVSSEPLPVVFSGLGSSAKVISADIPFDRGVIRPIGGVLEIPRNLSYSLPSLGANKFLKALQKADVLAGLDNMATITVLAPSDTAFKSVGNLTDAQLVDVLKQHVIVGFPAYTPLIADGDVYPTLGGRSLTVSIRDGVTSIGGVQILAGDAIIKNGVVHTISKVLTETATPAPPPTFTGAAITTKLLHPQVILFTLISLVVTARHCLL